MLTLDGMVTMKIPPGTQPETQLMLRGKGVRFINSPTRRYVCLFSASAGSILLQTLSPEVINM